MRSLVVLSLVLAAASPAGAQATDPPPLEQAPPLGTPAPTPALMPAPTPDLMPPPEREPPARELDESRPEPPPSERTRLVVYSTLLGTLQGIGLTESFGAASGLWIGLGITGGLAVPYFATRGSHVSGGMATAFMGMGLLGGGHGYLAYRMVLNDDTRQQDSKFGFTMAFFSMAESWAGYHLAKNLEMNRGQVQGMVQGGLLGGLHGLFYAALLRGDGDEGKSVRTRAGIGLLGSALGMVGGYLGATHRSYTEGDVYIVESASLAGAALGIWFGRDDAATTSVTAALGTGLGLLVGDRIVRGRDTSPGQGFRVVLVGVGCGLLGSVYGFFTSDADELGGAFDDMYVGAGLGFVAGVALGYLVIDRAPTAASGPSIVGMSPWTSMADDDARGLGLVGRY